MTSGLAGCRVVVVHGWATFGGAARQSFALARQLAAEGAAVEVCALTDEDGRAREVARELGIPWRTVTLDWSASRARKARALVRLAARLRGMRPDVLLPWCTPPNVLCGLVWRRTGAQLCVWNQADVLVPRRFRPAVVRRALGNVPLVVSNARHALDFLQATYGADPGRMRMIRNVVELPAARSSRPEWRERLGAADGDVVAVMLAELNQNKDHATLLRAWALVSERLGREGDGRAVLALAGRPATTGDALKALAYDLELGRAVRFLGDVADVGGLLGASDIGVLSSHSEGLPNGALECMAAGLPVAGTDLPGMREALGSEGAPLLAPPGDAEGLAAAIVRLVRDPDLRHAVGHANAARVREELGPERTLEEYAALLSSALEGAD